MFWLWLPPSPGGVSSAMKNFISDQDTVGLTGRHLAAGVADRRLSFDGKRKRETQAEGKGAQLPPSPGGGSSNDRPMVLGVSVMTAMENKTEAWEVNSAFGGGPHRQERGSGRADLMVWPHRQPLARCLCETAA